MSTQIEIDIESLRRLLSVIGNDRVMLEELIGDFVGDAQDLVRELRQAANEQDADRLRTAAHSLKSNAIDFGASRLGEVCAGLEAKAREKSLSDARDLAETVAGLVAGSVEALQKVSVAEI